MGSLPDKPFDHVASLLSLIRLVEFDLKTLLIQIKPNRSKIRNCIPYPIRFISNTMKRDFLPMVKHGRN